jgi:hypothetical protein
LASLQLKSVLSQANSAKIYIVRASRYVPPLRKLWFSREHGGIGMPEIIRVPHPQTGGLSDPLNQALSLILTERLDPKTKKRPRK